MTGNAIIGWRSDYGVCSQGHPGPAGGPGFPGLDGCNGTRGNQGLNGLPGVDGPDGAPVRSINQSINNDIIHSHSSCTLV